MVSPTALLPPEMPKTWLAQVGSVAGPQSSTAVSPPSSFSPLALKGCWQGNPTVLGQTRTQVKGSIQSLQEPGLCGHGVAQVRVKLELLRPLVTCCLVAGSPLLPARGFQPPPALALLPASAPSPQWAWRPLPARPDHAGEEL